MFGRKKSPDEASAVTHDVRPGAKNRPTPKRRDQEAARKRPLVVTDRKAARTADREQRRQALAVQRQAMATGDERFMPSRDKGPVRRFIRDSVDARYSLGEAMLPLMVVVMLLTLVRQNWALLIVPILLYGFLIAAIVDAVLMWKRMKQRIVEKFGAQTPMKGLPMYAAMRAFQIRRLRMPKPQVTRGTKLT